LKETTSGRAPAPTALIIAPDAGRRQQGRPAGLDPDFRLGIYLPNLPVTGAFGSKYFRGIFWSRMAAL